MNRKFIQVSVLACALTSTFFTASSARAAGCNIYGGFAGPSPASPGDTVYLNVAVSACNPTGLTAIGKVNDHIVGTQSINSSGQAQIVFLARAGMNNATITVAGQTIGPFFMNMPGTTPPSTTPTTTPPPTTLPSPPVPPALPTLPVTPTFPNAVTARPELPAPPATPSTSPNTRTPTSPSPKLEPSQRSTTTNSQPVTPTRTNTTTPASTTPTTATPAVPTSALPLVAAINAANATNSQKTNHTIRNRFALLAAALLGFMLLFTVTIGIREFSNRTK